MNKRETINEHTSPARVVCLSQRQGLALGLGLVLALSVACPAWAGEPVPRIDSIRAPSGLAGPGQPFEVEVRASNIGTDAEGGGSITLSLPDGGDVTVLDAGPGVRILPGNSTSDCKDANTHALVVKPGATCNTALQHNTACKTMLNVRYPLAESWYNPWRGGDQHYLRVRVSPRAGASRVTIYIRVAMRAQSSGCDLRLEPDESNAAAVDQQGFPVSVRTLVVNTPTPTWTPVPRPTTITPRPPTASPVPLTFTPRLPAPTTVMPTPTQVTPAIAGNLTWTPAATATPVPPATGNMVMVLGILGVLVLVLGGGIIASLAQRRSAARGSALGQPQSFGGTVPWPTPGPFVPPAGTTPLTQPVAPSCQKCGAALPPDVVACYACGTAVPVIGNRYRILSRLGQGGMGAVYLVEDLRISGKRWAIKEMRDAPNATPLERQQAMDAFLQEAHLLGRLDHINLPRVADFLNEADCHYLVMDFVEGETLERLLARRSAPFSAAEVLGWAGQLCDVLAYLHSQNPPVIFRDLKPGNIMLTHKGRLKLIDFGIARLFKPSRTRDTVNLGTPGYAAPEQYGGVRQSDPRSDVYALGVTLHELLTRYDPTATPFTLPKLRQLNPAVSARTEAAIERATQADPAHRFQTAIEMKRALGIQ